MDQYSEPYTALSRCVAHWEVDVVVAWRLLHWPEFLTGSAGRMPVSPVKAEGWP